MDKLAFIQKLQRLAQLSANAQVELSSLKIRFQEVKRRDKLVMEGSSPWLVYFVIEGWAARYASRRLRSRRILGFALPGDCLNLQSLDDVPFDHSVMAVTDCWIAAVDRAALRALIHRHPSVSDAIRRMQLLENAISRRWLLVSGDAEQATAHLLCELYERSTRDLSIKPDSIPFPLIQEESANALGITSVHLNRVIARLREQGLVDLRGRCLRILHKEHLYEAAQFDPSYMDTGAPTGFNIQ